MKQSKVIAVINDYLSVSGARFYMAQPSKTIDEYLSSPDRKIKLDTDAGDKPDCTHPTLVFHKKDKYRCNDCDKIITIKSNPSNHGN